MRRLITLHFILIAVCWPTMAGADRVTPTDRVDTRLRVRVEPNTDSEIRGWLYPGDTAELEGDVPYWYRRVEWTA